MIYLGCDHGGFALKEKLLQYLQTHGQQVTDCGSTVYDAEDDFTTCIQPVVTGVLAHPNHRGILICGSGVGMSIAANHVPGIRAALATNVDYARLARQHNHANVLCLGGRFTDFDTARAMVDVFLSTPPDPDPKYLLRMQAADGSK